MTDRSATTLTDSLTVGQVVLVEDPYFEGDGNPPLVECSIAQLTGEITPMGQEYMLLFPTDRNATWSLEATTVYLQDEATESTTTEQE